MLRPVVPARLTLLLVAALGGCLDADGGRADSPGVAASATDTGGAECVPGTCADVGAACGLVPDGCGAVVECGDCPDGELCGGGGANVCGPTSCTPVTCAGQCGPVSDGCGAVLDCDPCPDDATGGEETTGGEVTTGAEPPVPTFWEYRSENLSDEEIAAFNDPETGAASLGVNQPFHFDPDHADYWFKRAGGQTPHIDASGLLTSVRGEGDSNPHSGIDAWADGAGNTTEPAARSFPLHRRYRFGFDLYLPSGATAWLEQIDWAIILQCHQVSDGSSDPAGGVGRNPPFAITIESEDGQAYWGVTVRGDDRQFLPDKDYQYGPNASAAATGRASIAPSAAAAVDQWYRFEVETVWSYMALGETKVWIDDQLIYDNSARDDPEFKNCFNDWNDGVNIAPSLPYFGLYNYDLPTDMEVKYDRMWIADLGPAD